MSISLYRITSDLRDWAATIRKWKEFRRRTGKWPLFSIVASILHTASFIFGGAFLIWYSVEQGWSKNHFLLILLAVISPYVFVWAWLQKKIYLSELRRAGVHGWSGSDVGHEFHSMRHKTTTNRTGGWSQLVDASWCIDNAIFVILLALFAAAIIAKATFWLLGW